MTWNYYDIEKSDERMESLSMRLQASKELLESLESLKSQIESISQDEYNSLAESRPKFENRMKQLLAVKINPEIQLMKDMIARDEDEIREIRR